MTRERILILLMAMLTTALFVANLFVGTVDIPPLDVWNVLTGEADTVRPSWQFIVQEVRLPQALTALLCGAALAASGLMLQTAFRNPLAGPSILGIDSGASLGVAIVMLLSGGSLMAGKMALSGFLAVTVAAFVGAMAVMGLLLFFSTLLKSDVLLLIVGVMIGYAGSSIISLLNFFSTAEGVHSYMIWGMGSFGGVSMEQMPWFASLVTVGIVLSLLMVKPLNAMLLGNQYAENLGINMHRTRIYLLLATGLLAASTTAFCGPISFLGLAVPHMARLLLRKADHRTLMPLSLLTGTTVALLCNLLCTLPGDQGTVPLSAITPLLGVPVILYVLCHRRK
ncbi:MAG: iron ABC transporter permease [Bacteroidaceae bacterium]|nr:iron ABC transporter permease [Bacteroidaceae bacterium]MBR3897206.1 iron ABC transporter permease [Bacteroidaceae bacterium]